MLTDPILALYEAGRVRRFHTVPLVLGQDISQHSWGMAVLLKMLHPDPSPRLMWAVLAHDIHERYTGDVPWPAKDADPDVRVAVHRYAHRVERNLGLGIDLDLEEQNWLDALDMLELLLYSDLEVNTGNRSMEGPRKKAHQLLLDRRETPDEVRGFVESYAWRRTDDYA